MDGAMTLLRSLFRSLFAIMPERSRSGRWRSARALLVPALVVPVLLLAAPMPAGWADPASPDGKPSSLQAQLTSVSKAYTDASGRLSTARHRQSALNAQLADTNRRITEQSAEVNALAAASYRTGAVRSLAVMLDSGSPDDFVQRALTLHELAQYSGSQLRSLRELKATATQQQAALAQDIHAIGVQTAELTRRKAQLRQALDVAGGGPTTGVVIPAASADPAPRNSDGSFPDQSCSVKDPTTSGCLTPRTLHALQQARLAGFTHYTKCYRIESTGEHQKGRACDFAAAPNGFEGIATGSDRDYGNRLAGYFIANSDRLGVLYVIWYHQIWLPGVGWHHYTGDGTPSGDHMNHVHLSER
jgi:hypothetical protein